MSNTIEDPRPHTGHEVIYTRSPHDPAGHVPVDSLMAWWSSALRRIAGATATGSPVDVEDYWTELALRTRLAEEVTAGRWLVVARLLQAGAIGDWSEVGAALGMSGADAAAGFASWLVGQVICYRQTGIGVTAAEAEDLARLSDAVGGGAR